MNNPYIFSLRAPFRTELTNLSVKIEVAGMLQSEGGPIPTFESLCNRTNYMLSHGVKVTLHTMMHSGFYGPINRGELPRFIAEVTNSRALRSSLFFAIDYVLAGSNVIQGYTDQGLLSDPNGHHKPALVVGGNVYNDWGGGPSGHEGALRWRNEFEQNAIKTLQRALNAAMSAGGSGALGGIADILVEDGIMGAQTEKVLMAFQKESNLTPDGIEGPATWEALLALPSVSALFAKASV